VTSGYEPSPDDFKWELYNINEDFSQSNDLAARNPEKLKELQDAFDVEAKKYNVYPLDSSFASRADPAIRPSLTRDRSAFVYFPGMIRIARRIVAPPPMWIASCAARSRAISRCSYRPSSRWS
jgi:arylsulfatase